MKAYKLSYFLLLNFILCSCGQITGEYTGANIVEKTLDTIVGGIDAISTKNGSFLLKGTADNGGRSAHSYHLKFRLPEGSSLKFYFFADKELSNGVIFEFSKKLNKTRMEIQINGKSHSHNLDSLDNREIIDIDIDIHNDHSDIHMLVWDHTGAHGDNEECTFEGDCLYNTEDFALDTWLGVGKASGSFWGFSGDSNQVILLEGPLGALSDV